MHYLKTCGSSSRKRNARERKRDMKILTDEEALSPVLFFAPLFGFALGMAVSLMAIWWI